MEEFEDKLRDLDFILEAIPSCHLILMTPL